MKAKSESRMYKIYVNEARLLLVETESWQRVQEAQVDEGIALMWVPRPKTIFNIIDNLMKGAHDYIILYGHDPKSILKYIKKLYKHVVACGGVVSLETTNEILMMYRRDNWDLPKGKQDLGESKKQTAVREVMEETGLKEIQLLEKLGKTYHMFIGQRGGKIIKTTHWYIMETGQKHLTPQTEEDIEEVRWVKLDDAFQLHPMYGNIRNTLYKYQKWLNS